MVRINGDREHRGGLAAASIGAAALGVGELIAATRGDSLIDAIGRVMTDIAPVPVVETTVALSGKHDKVATRIGVGTGAIAATVGLGALSDRARTPAVAAFGATAAALGLRRPTRSPATVAGAAAAAGVLGIGLRRRPRGLFGTLVWAGAGAGLLVAARALNRDYDRRQHEAIDRVGPMGGISVVPQDGLEDEPGLSSLITANRSFYVADVNLSPPRIDPARWRLSVTGRVAHPLRLSLTELAADAVEFDAVMVCVHNRPGERRAGNGRWYGVPLAKVLEHAVPETGATRLVTRAVDGYTISLPVEPLRSGEWPGYVVIGVNGAPLAPEHGFPARIFVPGLYGQYTGAKWLAELELTDDSHIDYWWKRGWPSEPMWVTPQARIDVTAPGRAGAGTTSIAGVAWAPPHGIDGVELRIDAGDWRPVDLGTETAPAAWRRWRTTLDLPAGEHTLQARAISRSGEVQDGTARSPFPSGPSGFHTVTIKI